jgi:hypothetical protein
MPPLSRQEHRSNGVFPGLQLSHYDRGKHPDVLNEFRQGYPWDELKRQKPGLAECVQASGECLILRGELEDQSDLNYLRDTVGLLTFLLDHVRACYGCFAFLNLSARSIFVMPVSDLAFAMPVSPAQRTQTAQATLTSRNP